MKAHILDKGRAHLKHTYKRVHLAIIAPVWQSTCHSTTKGQSNGGGTAVAKLRLLLHVRRGRLCVLCPTYKKISTNCIVKIKPTSRYLYSAV